MDHGTHHDGMQGDHGTPASNNNGTMGTMHHKMMMHMTFYWGKNAEILFSGWPGSSTNMYVLSLIAVFLLSMLIECFSHPRFLRRCSSHVSAGLLQTLLHMLRVGSSYLVMLAVMSFNGGIFLMAIAGHSIGFLLFRSRILKYEELPQRERPKDLSTMPC